jgi:hypothetical protein
MTGCATTGSVPRRSTRSPSRADLGEQHHWVGPSAELSQPVLGFVGDLCMRQHPIHRRRRRVVLLDHPGADPLLLFKLEGPKST